MSPFATRRPGRVTVRPGPHVVAVLAVAVLAGCGSAARPPVPPASSAPPPATSPVQPAGTPTGQVTIAAATVLTDAFTTLGTEFEKAYPGTKVAFTFGDSDALARQLAAGPRPDLFAAAGPAVRRVTDAGLAEGAPKVLVRNRLVIAVAAKNPARVFGFADLPRVRVTACTVDAPCGAAAKKVLDAAGAKVKPVSFERDAKAALAKVKSGRADAALVYRTDATGADFHSVDFEQAAAVADDLPIVALKSAANPTGAAAFLGFASSAYARHVFDGAGFELP